MNPGAPLPPLWMVAIFQARVSMESALHSVVYSVSLIVVLTVCSPSPGEELLTHSVQSGAMGGLVRDCTGALPSRDSRTG